MDSVGESGDPFAIPDLWRPSTLAGKDLDNPDHFSTALGDIGRRLCAFAREERLINIVRLSRRCTYTLPTSQRP